MKLLTELLALEAQAKVHVNGPLSVLINLVQAKFGPDLDEFPLWNKCLAAQFAYILNARTGLSIKQCIEIFRDRYFSNYDDSIRHRMRSVGITPQELLDIFDDSTIRVHGSLYQLTCSFQKFEGISDIAQGVASGHPIIIPYIVSSDFANGVENHIDGIFNPMYANGKYAPPKEKDYAHSLLAIGVDYESKELILRDLRDDYLFKGYVKVPFTVVDVQIPLAFTFDIDIKKIKLAKPSALKDDERYAIAS